MLPHSIIGSDFRRGLTTRAWGPLAILAVAMLLSACSGGQANHNASTSPNATRITPPTTTASPDPRGPSSQSVLDNAINADAPGCSAAVGIDGNLVWTGVRGIANLTTGAAISAATVFDIASETKQFTAAAILLLVEAHKLTLDDLLSQHVSGLPAWATSVTVAQLMHQTSGIPDYVGLLGANFAGRTTQQQALQALAAVPKLEFPPGTKWEYSNSNYVLLAEIVSRVSGQSLPDFLSTNVFRPLDLAMVLAPNSNVPNKATSYVKGDDGVFTEAESRWEQVGDGGIQTTPTQMVRWADNYRTGKVGGQKLLDLQLAGTVKTDLGGDTRYGAGIFVFADDSLEHGGSWLGFLTEFWISSDRHTSVAVSCNTSSQQPAFIAAALEHVWT